MKHFAKAGTHDAVSFVGTGVIAKAMARARPAKCLRRQTMKEAALAGRSVPLAALLLLIGLHRECLVTNVHSTIS